MQRPDLRRLRPAWTTDFRPLVLVQTWLLLLLLTAGALAVLIEARHDAQTRGRERVLGVARTLAASPFVLSAALTDDAPTRLGTYAEDVRRANELSLVVVMAPDRTLWTHPDPRRVGEQFDGTIQPALDGEAFTEVSSGSADPSVRTVAPVSDADGTVVALVAVETNTGSLAAETLRRLPLLLLVLVLAIALAYAGGGLVKRLERQRSARARRSSRSVARPTDA